MATTSKRVRAPSFKLEVPGDSTVKEGIMKKITSVRDALMKSLSQPQVTHAQILDTVLSYWLESQATTPRGPSVSTHQEISEHQSTEDIFLTTQSSLDKLIALAEDHGRYCASRLSIFRYHTKGHVILAKLKCRHMVKHSHSFWWSSSPKLLNGDYLVNERVNHGLVFSGMRPSHYTRFTKGAGIGYINKMKRRKFVSDMKPIIEEEYCDNIDTALLQEIASNCPLPSNAESMETVPDNDDWYGIDIMTDARHGHRKNAKDSSIVAIGEKTGKVLYHAHVKKHVDDHVTQRHEKIGTEAVYTYLTSKEVPVRTHIHDRNLTINKLVKDKADTVNQNDTWHGIKSLKQNVDSVSSGPKYKHNVTWHEQLQDKVEPIGTHANWAIRNCKGDEGTLQASLLNSVDHYMDNHTNCAARSRCKQDPNYEPSRIPITSTKAEQLLRDSITKSTLYKSASDFVLGRSTAHVESFNNTMNMFHDKRIYYGDLEYEMRSMMAVLHWNENVGRPHTSVWTPQVTTSAPTRRSKSRRNYKECTYKYRQLAWKSYIHTVYTAGKK